MLVDGRWEEKDGVHYLQVPGQNQRTVRQHMGRWLFEHDLGGPHVAGERFDTLDQAKGAAEFAAELRAFRLLSEPAKQVLREAGLL